MWISLPCPAPKASVEIELAFLSVIAPCTFTSIADWAALVVLVAVRNAWSITNSPLRIRMTAEPEDGDPGLPSWAPDKVGTRTSPGEVTVAM